MITIIRNDPQMRFAHDVQGIKLKNEKPMYSIIASIPNEGGLPVFKSTDYKEISIVFDRIVQAITNSESYIVLDPPHSKKVRPAEECEFDGVMDFGDCSEKHCHPPINMDVDTYREHKHYSKCPPDFHEMDDPRLIHGNCEHDNEVFDPYQPRYNDDDNVFQNPPPKYPKFMQEDRIKPPPCPHSPHFNHYKDDVKEW